MGMNGTKMQQNESNVNYVESALRNRPGNFNRRNNQGIKLGSGIMLLFRMLLYQVIITRQQYVVVVRVAVARLVYHSKR